MSRWWVEGREDDISLPGVEYVYIILDSDGDFVAAVRPGGDADAIVYGHNHFSYERGAF